MWDHLLAAGAVPCGLGARDTLRLEVCYPLHGNDITPDTNAIAAGLGWVCALQKDFTGVDVLRRTKEEGPSERLVAFRMAERAIPRGGMPIHDAGGATIGAVTSGTLSPSLDEGVGMGYVRTDQAGHGNADRHRCARPQQGRGRRSQAIAQEEGVVATMAEGVYPDDLRYHREHDWVRLDGDEAVFGITWYAQDSLGEVVYFDPPGIGAQVTADEPYGELESVKAVSDVIAPLSGEVTGVNEAVHREPRPREQGSVRRGLADPGAARRRRLRRRRCSTSPHTARCFLSRMRGVRRLVLLALTILLVAVVPADAKRVGLGVKGVAFCTTKTVNVRLTDGSIVARRHVSCRAGRSRPS